jgi:hypothetical protein
MQASPTNAVNYAFLLVTVLLGSLGLFVPFALGEPESRERYIARWICYAGWKMIAKEVAG